jgi:hypothetical protein
MKDLNLTKMDNDMPCCVGEGPKGPTVHLEQKEPIELPDKGTGTLTFKVTRRTHNVLQKRWEVTLELVKLTDIKGNKKVLPPPKEVETGEALDALMAEMGED